MSGSSARLSIGTMGVWNLHLQAGHALQCETTGAGGRIGDLRKCRPRREELAVRLDYGSVNCSEHFQGGIMRLGIKSCYSFVGEPQTNGVVKRFNRILKEQAIYRQISHTLDAVWEAVLSSRAECNPSLRLEKLGFMPPSGISYIRTADSPGAGRHAKPMLAINNMAEFTSESREIAA